MGSSKIFIDQPASSPVALDGNYGNRSGTIDSKSNDVVLLIVSLDAGPGVTSINLKPVVFDGSDYVSIYRQGENGMVEDVISIPVSADTTDQKRAVRVDTRGVREFFLDGLVNGGASGAIRSVKTIRDGSSTDTPNL